MKPSPAPESGVRAGLRAKGFVPAVEAAARLGYAPQTVYDWMDAGRIHGVRLRRSRWVEWKTVVAFFKQHDPEAAKLAGLA